MISLQYGYSASHEFWHPDSHQNSAVIARWDVCYLND
jgi:hypothetical protein